MQFESTRRRNREGKRPKSKLDNNFQEEDVYTTIEGMRERTKQRGRGREKKRKKRRRRSIQISQVRSDKVPKGELLLLAGTTASNGRQEVPTRVLVLALLITPLANGELGIELSAFYELFATIMMTYGDAGCLSTWSAPCRFASLPSNFVQERAGQDKRAGLLTRGSWSWSWSLGLGLPQLHNGLILTVLANLANCAGLVPDGPDRLTAA